MPLPAALRAKLQQRGILDDNGMPVSSSPVGGGGGFVAPRPKALPSTATLAARSAQLAVRDTEIVTSFIGCPNKINPYHVCVEFCRQQWGSGFTEPEKYTEKKRQLMLLKYPKPAGWKEIYDPGTGRHYYWNVRTDDVSWLPPEHPKAYLTISANRLRAILVKSDFKPVPEVSKYLPHSIQIFPVSMSIDDGPDGGSQMRDRFDQEYGTVQRHPAGGKAARYKPDRGNDFLDPMDPAAYSDVPRGGWGMGLETGGDAKTGVDATASGPLFQSRPYPSPGSILRRNAGVPDKKK